MALILKYFFLADVLFLGRRLRVVFHWGKYGKNDKTGKVV
jgi:hypothetical protein